jgi:hypothetical protein
MQRILCSCDRASWQILIIKPTRCTNFSNLFWNETLHVSDSSSVHHQELSTAHTAMVYVRFVDSFRAGSGSNWVPSWFCCCSKAVYKPVWHMPLLSVQWITPDDVQRNCPKHVEFNFQNNFEKLLKLVGFVKRRKNTQRVLTFKMWLSQAPLNVAYVDFVL